MKIFLVLASLFLLVGCQPSAEDRDFFYSGWVRPGETGHARPRDVPIEPVP